MRVRTESHEAPHDQMSGALHVVFGRLKRLNKFGASEWGQAKCLDQARGLLFVAQHPEKIDHDIVEIVVDLGIYPRLAHEHRARAAERLDIDSMLRKILQDERRELPLAAMPAQHRARRGVHSGCSGVATAFCASINCSRQFTNSIC